MTVMADYSVHDDYITLAHGAGGQRMRDLIEGHIVPLCPSPELRLMDDAAAVNVGKASIAFTTDSFVVQPLFFPGGDIGSLAVSGTVNDLLMKGARPLYLSLGFIIEEGFPVTRLDRILDSIATTCSLAGVSIVTGDTKVVGKGQADGLYINTSGIGEILPSVSVSGSNARPSDKIIVSGSIGRHGIAVMAERNGLNLRTPVSSDAGPLTDSVIPLLTSFAESVHVLRDPTRGGIAAALTEIAAASGITVTIDETAVPVDNQVAAVCELLGFDPLHLPCEGRFVAFVEGDAADDILTFLSVECRLQDARILGEVSDAYPGHVYLMSSAGALKILDRPDGEMLPRIC